MKKTFKELRDIDLMVGGLYGEFPHLKKTKFGYAYKRFIDKSYQPIFNEFQDEINSCRIDNALENPITKEVMLDKENPRGFKYSRDGLRNCIEQEKKISKNWESREVEVTPFIIPVIPDELNEFQVDQLRGIIFENLI